MTRPRTIRLSQALALRVTAPIYPVVVPDGIGRRVSESGPTFSPQHLTDPARSVRSGGRWLQRGDLPFAPATRPSGASYQPAVLPQETLRMIGRPGARWGLCRLQNFGAG